MFTNNLIGLLISGTIYIATVIFYNEDTHLRILKNPNILFDCVMVDLSGSIGQIFIFLTVSLFDCYLLTVITTTRKFFSVVYSNFRFGHNFNGMQWFGAVIVMFCSSIELLNIDFDPVDWFYKKTEPVKSDNKNKKVHKS